MAEVSVIGNSFSCGASAVGGDPLLQINGKNVYLLTHTNSHGAPQIQASSILRVNGLGAARVGDNCASHYSKPVHSPNPLVNGCGILRVSR